MSKLNESINNIKLKDESDEKMYDDLTLINEDVLNKQQEEIVNCFYGPVLVLAAAGTGKTKTLVSRFIKLINQESINKYKILCVTFSNKASNEMLERISKNIENNGLWVGTFHSICYRLLQTFQLISPNTSIIDEEDQKKIANKLDIVKNMIEISSKREDMNVHLTLDQQIDLKKYESFLMENSLLDFSGILSKMYNLLNENQDLCTQIQQKFSHIMVDEYQDTSKLQNNILMKILNKDQNIFCVGDDDQSIYSWRGADITNILNFQNTFQNANIFKLENNYRSTKQIVEVANSVVRYSKNRLSKRMISNNNGFKVTLCCSKNEFSYIARTIQELPINKTSAILIRSASILANLEQELISYHVPYKVFGGMRFFEKLEIKTAISYLKAIFLSDIIALEKALTIPKKGIGPKKINSINSFISLGYSIIESLREVKLYEFANKMLSWKNLTNNPGQILHTILEESGLYEFFTNEPNRLDNLNILIKKISNFKTVEEFLHNFFSIDMDNREKKHTLIMTIHASKGLEFDYIFIPCLIEGIFPHIKSIKSGTVEEERRLLYVAITRAKEKLIMTYNLGQRMFYQLFGPSRFLNNLDKRYIDFITF